MANVIVIKDASGSEYRFAPINIESVNLMFTESGTWYVYLQKKTGNPIVITCDKDKGTTEVLDFFVKLKEEIFSEKHVTTMVTPDGSTLKQGNQFYDGDIEW